MNLKVVKIPRGFTLLEVLLALAILGILMTIAYATMSGLIASTAAIKDIQDSRAVANAFLLRFTRELQLANFGSVALLPSCQNQTATAVSSAKLIGTEEKLPNQFSGDSIRFVAAEGGQYLPDGGGHTGLVHLTYRVAPDPDQPSGPEATYLLIREEIPNIRPLARACERAMIFPIAKNVVSFELLYYDETTIKWLSTWGGAGSDRLPQMVIFKLRIKSSSGRVDTYQSTVAVRAS